MWETGRAVANDTSNPFVCNICGGRRFTELGLRVDKQPVVSCCECRMGVLRQIPRDTSIFYTDDYYGGQATRGREYANYEFTAAHSLTWVALLVRALLPRGRVLDVGCANGYLLQRLGPDIEKFGVEVNATEVQKARTSGIKILGTDVLASRLAEDYRGFFDVVTAIATFEHVIDLRRVVELCLDSLSPSGILIFEVPLLSEGNNNSKWFESSLEHIYYPTVPGIEHLFRKTLAAHLMGREVVIEGFASNYVGIASRAAGFAPKVERLFEVLWSDTLEGLSEEEKVVNLAFTALHRFDPTPERILALPALFRRVPDPNIFERMTQLWHADAVSLRNIPQVAAEADRSSFSRPNECSIAASRVLPGDVQAVTIALLQQNLALLSEELRAIKDSYSAASQYAEALRAEMAIRKQLTDQQQRIVSLEERPQGQSDETRRLNEEAWRLESMSEQLRFEHGLAIDQLNAILMSSTWRGTEGLRRFLSKRPRLARLARHSVKLAYWTATGQLYRKLRSLYPVSISATAFNIGRSVKFETSANGSGVSAPSSGSNPARPKVDEAWPPAKPYLTIVLFGASDDALQSSIHAALDSTTVRSEVVLVTQDVTSGGAERRASFAHSRLRRYDLPPDDDVDPRDFAFGRSFGKYLCFIEPFDRLRPGYLERAIKQLDSTGGDLAGNPPVDTNELVATPVFRRSLLERIGGLGQFGLGAVGRAKLATALVESGAQLAVIED
jgi:SAM-dependent methyltransferase